MRKLTPHTNKPFLNRTFHLQIYSTLKLFFAHFPSILVNFTLDIIDLVRVPESQHSVTDELEILGGRVNARGALGILLPPLPIELLMGGR